MSIKKIIYIVLFFFSQSWYSQQEYNRFLESENSDAVGKDETIGDNVEQAPDIAAKDGIGNPNQPAPIDDYIPLLLLAAVGIIAYTTYRKKATQ